jgi:cytochrome c6
MKKAWLGVAFCCLMVFLYACGKGGEQGGSNPAPAAGPDGKALFEMHCASCHKDGGNVINPGKTLSRSDREAGGITTANDVVKVIRHPRGPGMPRFDEATLTDEQARAIAEYVIQSF